MKGKYELIISNNKLKYDIVLERNITIIKGDSGTGKSTLYTFFYNLIWYGKRETGYHCNCKDKLVLAGDENWAELVKKCKNKIFIFDEYFDFVTTKEFAKAIQNSDNYFIIISRSGRMQWLTYSVNSCYHLGTVKEGNMYCTRLYERYLDTGLKLKPDLIITEDSNSGYEMFNSIVNSRVCKIISANGRDNVYNKIIENIDKYKCIYCIVDGAAFGSCIGKVFPKFYGRNIYLFTPESFEYLLLSIKTFSRYCISELSETYNFCDSVDYVSWEGYYTDLLKQLCSELYGVRYYKFKLNSFFKSDYYKNGIKNLLKDLDKGVFI